MTRLTSKSAAYVLAALGLGLSDYRMPEMSRGSKTPRSPIKANAVARNRKANKQARKMRKNK